MTCCFTGHRKFSHSVDIARLKEQLNAAIEAAVKKGVTHFICGNAVGVDTWAAELVLKIKKQNPFVFLEIAVPFENHNIQILECVAVQRKADLVHVVSSETCFSAAFHERNRYMVDHSDMLICICEKSKNTGGTAKTIAYAEKQGLEIVRVPV